MCSVCSTVCMWYGSIDDDGGVFICGENTTTVWVRRRVTVTVRTLIVHGNTTSHIQATSDLI